MLQKSIQQNKVSIVCDLCGELLVDQYHNVYQHQMKKHGKLGNVRGKLASKAGNNVFSRPIKKEIDENALIRISIIMAGQKFTVINDFKTWKKWAKADKDWLTTKKQDELLLLACIATFKTEYVSYLG